MNYSNSIRLSAAGFALAAGLSGQAALAASTAATASITDISTTLLTLANDQFLSDATTAKDTQSTPLHTAFDAGSVLPSYFFNDTAANGDSAYAEIDNGFAPLPQTHAGATHSGFGTATVLWTFDWVATATGVATLNLEYLYSAAVANLGAGETGLASARIGALLDGTPIGQEAFYFFSNTEDNTFGFDNLVLNFDVTAGDTGTFTVTLASNALAAPAPVPVPAAVWLFGSALMGLGGLHRRLPA